MNKALLDVGGKPIIARVLHALGPLARERVLLTNDATLHTLEDVRLVYDALPHAGVLPALASGLAEASGDVCLAVACDMPFVSRRLFEQLLDLQSSTGADVVIPRMLGLLEPMHAVYRTRTVRHAIEKALERGERRMVSYFQDVQVRQVDELEWRSSDPRGLAFFNVNTPEDLAEARRVAESETDDQVSGQG